MSGPGNLQRFSRGSPLTSLGPWNHPANPVRTMTASPLAQLDASHANPGARLRPVQWVGTADSDAPETAGKGSTLARSRQATVKLTLMLGEQRRTWVVRAVRDRAESFGVSMSVVGHDDHRAVVVELAGDPIDVDAAADDIGDWWVLTRRFVR